MQKKRAVSLSVVGATTYKMVQNILSPEKPGEKTYTELVEKLSRHFKPAPCSFGIALAPGIFQSVIESILQGIEGAVVYLDDILITGSSEEAHLKTLDEVLSRLDRARLRVRQGK